MGIFVIGLVREGLFAIWKMWWWVLAQAVHHGHFGFLSCHVLAVQGHCWYRRQRAVLWAVRIQTEREAGEKLEAFGGNCLGEEGIQYSRRISACKWDGKENDIMIKSRAISIDVKSGNLRYIAGKWISENKVVIGNLGAGQLNEHYSSCLQQCWEASHLEEAIPNLSYGTMDRWLRSI